MKTIKQCFASKKPFPFLFFCAIGLMFFFLFPEAISAKHAKLSLSLDAAILWPSQKPVRDVYSAISFPLTLRFSYSLLPKFSVYAGFRFMHTRGETRLLFQNIVEEPTKTRLTIYSPQMGLTFMAVAKKIHFHLSAGMAYHSYREEWQDIPISFSGKCLGFQFDGAIVIPLKKHLSLQGKIEYLSIPTGKGSMLEEIVNLGGIATGLGLMFCF